MMNVNMSKQPTAPEVADVLQEVLNQWSLGNDGQANHLLDELILHIEDRDTHAGSAFLVEHLNQLANQLNANLEVEVTLNEMIKTLRSGLA